MARRTIIALTDAQAHYLRIAIKGYVEGGAGWDDASTKRIEDHLNNVERQMRREYTSAERVAIFEEATRLTAAPTAGGGDADH